MSIDERGQRQCLEQSVGHASTPRNPVWESARQLLRQRFRVITAVGDALIAAAAVAVAVPVALSVANWQPAGRRRPTTPELSYTITVDGLAPASPGPDSSLPRFVISPGEDLSFTVDVTVPEDVTVTGLWLGITAGILSPRRDGPENMNPVLAAFTDTTLPPGAHRFSFHWVVPAELGPGTKRELSVQMAWHARSSGLSERFLAQLEVQEKDIRIFRPGN
jgi:hypothetical protein